MDLSFSYRICSSLHREWQHWFRYWSTARIALVLKILCFNYSLWCLFAKKQVTHVIHCMWQTSHPYFIARRFFNVVPVPEPASSIFCSIANITTNSTVLSITGFRTAYLFKTCESLRSSALPYPSSSITNRDYLRVTTSCITTGSADFNRNSQDWNKFSNWKPFIIGIVLWKPRARDEDRNQANSAIVKKRSARW